MSLDGVVLFHTSSAALRAEKICQRAQIAVKLVPTPRELSSDCGIALSFAWSQLEEMKTLLAAGRVDTAGIHSLIRARGAVT